MDMRNLSRLVVNLKKEELRDMAIEQVERLMPYCLQADPEYRGCMALHSVLLGILHADQKFEAKEKALMLRLLGPQDIECFGKLMTAEEAEKKAVEFLQSYPDAREPAMLLCMAIAGCDETITLKEREFIQKFLIREKTDGED